MNPYSQEPQRDHYKNPLPPKDWQINVFRVAREITRLEVGDLGVQGDGYWVEEQKRRWIRLAIHRRKLIGVGDKCNLQGIGKKG